MQTENTRPDDDLPSLLVAARRHHARLAAPAAVPIDDEAAYAAQHRTLALLGERVAGWKVGSAAPDAPVFGAPLPAGGVLASGARLRLADFPVLALELEIAFRFARSFEPGGPLPDDAAVQAAIGSMLATIELVTSRCAGWPDVDRRLQLADLQNHGALVCGEAVPYDAGYAWAAPGLAFTLAGADIAQGRAANPAGDPRRLLGWAVRHALARGVAVTPDTVFTAGSYVGAHLTHSAGDVVGRFEGLPEVHLTLAS